MSKAAAALCVTGTVQGVGYRYFFYRRALELGLTGWVRNDPGGSVTAEVEGEKSDIQSLIDYLKRGPSSARVADIGVKWHDYTGRFSSFEVTR